MMQTNKIIWYLYPYAGSPSLGMMTRPYFLAKQFKKRNHNTFVVSASFHHSKSINLPQQQRLVSEEIDGVPYFWLKTPRYKKNNLARVLNMLTYSMRVWTQHKKMRAISGKPDVIIVSEPHPLHFFSALYLARRYKAKLILEVRDLWPLSLIDLLGMSRYNPICLGLSIIEKCAYKYSAHIVSLLEYSKPYMCANGLDPEKFLYIPNAVALQEESNDSLIKEAPQDLIDYISQLQAQGKFVLGYLGSHGPPNGLYQLINAMQHLQAEGQRHIHLLLIGDGVSKNKLLESAKHLDNVSFYGYVPPKVVPIILKNLQAVVFCLKPRKLFEFGISPNKLLDYMLAEKPIISTRVELVDRVDKANCGISVPPDDPAAMANAMKEMASLDSDSLLEKGRNGCSYLLKWHSYEKIAKQYEPLFY